MKTLPWVVTTANCLRPANCLPCLRPADWWKVYPGFPRSLPCPRLAAVHPAVHGHNQPQQYMGIINLAHVRYAVPAHACPVRITSSWVRLWIPITRVGRDVDLREWVRRVWVRLQIPIPSKPYCKDSEYKHLLNDQTATESQAQYPLLHPPATFPTCGPRTPWTLNAI